MNGPTMFETRTVARDTESFGAYLPIPGFGVLPVNAFLIRSAQPVLIDTALAALGDQFLGNLRNAIDPERLRWIWITHADPDHIGNLQAVLAAAPNARVVTTYVGMAKMGLHGLPLERMYLLNPGQQLDVGDRMLTAISPPTFDAPETCGVFDTKTDTLFSADSFGALMQEPAETAADISPAGLKAGCIAWATVDAPWLHAIHPGRFGQILDDIRRLDAKTVLSTHLPPAHGMTGQLLDYLSEAPRADRFVGPDQAALQRLMAA